MTKKANSIFDAKQIKKLNDLEIEVFEYIMSNSLIIPYLTIRELADNVGVSTTTILRFVKKIGYDSYNDFKFAYKMSLQSEEHFERIYDFSEVIECLKKFSTSYYLDKFNEAMVIIGNSENVVFFGVGNSGTICQYGARRFTSAGKFTMAVNDPFLKMASLNPSTVVIVLSVSGETPEVIDTLATLKKESCKIIAITTSQSCTIAKMADLTIPYYINKIGTDVFDMTSQIPVVAIIENLATMCFHK